MDTDDTTPVFFALAMILALVFIYVAVIKLTPPAARETSPETEARHHPESGQVLKDLIDSGATFYGASWCGFTKKQLAVLGISETESQGLDYVDCQAEEEHCREKGIEAFPTWQIHGQMHPGYYPVEKLGLLVRNRPA